MRLAAKRLERALQLPERGAGVSEDLLAVIQQVQLIEAQRADDNNVAIVVVAVRRRAFRQAGVSRLHENDFVGGDANFQYAP